MSAFDLSQALSRAAERFGEPRKMRRARSDRGKSRFPPEVAAELRAALLGQERPPMATVLERLQTFCKSRNLRPPARATVYEWMENVLVPTYLIEELPAAVCETLYNLPPAGEIPGPQLAFHCFNFGNLGAMSFAAGLPWLTLHQAARSRGWRRGSRGALAAVLTVRGISS